jgi:hypothetical protein
MSTTTTAPPEMTWYPLWKECIKTNGAGIDFEEFTCVSPLLARTHTQ